jgi:uncharacterized membrane protein YedE/YeeE
VKRVFALLGGLWFGILLIKAGVASWEKIRNMFALHEPDLFLIIGSAIFTGMTLLWLIRRFNLRTIDGHSPEIPPKKFHKGLIFGGLLFGMGWAITGACPGPVYAQIGAGEYMSLFTLAGAVAGTWLYSFLRPRLPH